MACQLHKHVHHAAGIEVAVEALVEAQVPRLNPVAHVAWGLCAALDLEYALDLVSHASIALRGKFHGGAGHGAVTSAGCTAARVC